MDIHITLDENTEHVVLIDNTNTPIGLAPKATVHTKETPLHRAFSSFLFNNKKELLLQQRSHYKVTWPLIWSNSCCGHPKLFESNEDAVYRRLKVELNITDVAVTEMIPDYQYRFEHKGVVEHERCPVFVGRLDHDPVPNPQEVEAFKWMPWDQFLATIKQPDHGFSEWCAEEAQLLEKNEKFQQFLWKLS